MVYVLDSTSGLADRYTTGAIHHHITLCCLEIHYYNCSSHTVMAPHFKSIATSRFICNVFFFSSCAQIHKGTQEMEKQQKLDAPAPNSCIYNARVHIGKLKMG